MSTPNDDGETPVQATTNPTYEELLSVARAHQTKCLNTCGCSVCVFLRKVDSESEWAA